VPTGGEHNFTVNDVVVSWQNASSFGWLFSGSEQMRLTSTGLGIGTTSPGVKLDVVGVARASTRVVSPEFYGSGTGITQYMDSLGTTGMYVTGAGASPSNSIRFFSAGTTTATIDSAGNLGLGATPSAVSSGWTALQIKSTGSTIRSNGANFTQMWQNANGELKYSSSSILAGGYSIGNGQHVWYTAPTGTAGNAITFTEVMTLTAAGALVLGATTPTADTLLTLRQSATNSAALALINRNATQTWRISTDAAAVDDKILGFIDTTTSTVRLGLSDTGNLLLGGTASPASATKSFAIFNGTAPTGSVTDGCVLYTEDVSSSSELKVRDEAGNVTTLSPHNFELIPEGPSEEMAWSYYSERDGKRINVDMLKAIRLLEKLSGERLVYEA
jgi:hypothetical protein